MKTAIEMLVEYYEELVPGIENVGIDKFLDLEKQQIINAHNKGQQYYNSGYNPTVSEYYYNEAFETNKETLK